MGFGGISIWQLLIVLAIVVLIFGTKKLKNMGSDVGGAVKNFKDAMKNEDKAGDEDEDFHQRLSSEDDSPEDGKDEKSSHEQSRDNDRQS